MRSRQSFIATLFLAGLALSGCSPGRYVDEITIEPSQTLETLRVALVFRRNVQTELQGNFPIDEYGYLFINPFTETRPFEIGFVLNTDILLREAPVQMEPTRYLPNGFPLPIGYPLVSLGELDAGDGMVDAYGYIDILHRSWAGIAALFNFAGKGNFPDSLFLTASFLADDSRTPRAHAMIFGPVLDGAGKLKTPGGVAIFSNVRALLPRLQKRDRMTLHRHDFWRIEGKDAEIYRAYPERLLPYERRILSSLKKAKTRTQP